MIDHRGKIDLSLAKHSHTRALKIRAGPLNFFDPPDLRGQTEASRSNKFHRLSLRISTYKKSAGAHVMNRWRRSGNVVERSETVAQVAQAMIFGQRDLRLLSCEGAYVAASATPLECTLTQKGGRGVSAANVMDIRSFAAQSSQQKQIPRAKGALVMTTWRSGGGIVAWKAEVTPAMISGNVVTLAGHFVVLSGASRLLFFQKSRLRDFCRDAKSKNPSYVLGMEVTWGKYRSGLGRVCRAEDPGATLKPARRITVYPD